MDGSELGFGEVVDLSPVQVNDAGHLFISPVIHDWTVVTQRGIDTVIDLEGGLDVGVPTAPNECLYVYFPILDEQLPNLNKLHGVAPMVGLTLHKLGMSGPEVITRLRARRPGALFNDQFAAFLDAL